MAPMFPLQTEKAHNVEVILSEAPGHYSREAAQLADPITVRPGQPLTLSSVATTDHPAIYALATAGANCHAIALYGGSSSSGSDLRISCLQRACEVNGKLIDWGTISAAEQVIGIATLLTKGIVVRQ